MRRIATAKPALMQIYADVTGKEIKVADTVQTAPLERYVRRRGGRHRAGRLWEHRRGEKPLLVFVKRPLSRLRPTCVYMINYTRNIKDFMIIWEEAKTGVETLEDIKERKITGMNERFNA